MKSLRKAATKGVSAGWLIKGLFYVEPGWCWITSADRCENIRAQSVRSPQRKPLLTSNRLFNMSCSMKMATSLLGVYHVLPSFLSVFFVGHCVSLHTFSKSPRPGLLLPRDLGFLPAQHMLHSYRLCVVLACLFSFPSMQPRSVFHKKPGGLVNASWEKRWRNNGTAWRQIVSLKTFCCIFLIFVWRNTEEMAVQ